MYILVLQPRQYPRTTTEMVLETDFSPFNHLTRLVTRGYFIVQMHRIPETISPPCEAAARSSVVTVYHRV
jgi:hypothetical protein